MSTTIKSFKVSELPEIPDVDGNDLLMVSEHESGNKYMTKKMSVS